MTRITSEDLDSNQLTLVSLGSLCGMGLLNLVYSFFLSSTYLFLIGTILLGMGIMGIKSSFHLLLLKR